MWTKEAASIAGFFAIFAFLPCDASAYTLTMLEAPGALSTSAVGINASGLVVGNYYVQNPGFGVRYHGYIYQAGAFQVIDPPGSLYTNVSGVSDDGTVIGTYQITSLKLKQVYGFTYKNGVYTIFGQPGVETMLQAISPDGQTIVGTQAAVASQKYAFFAMKNGVTTRKTTLSYSGFFTGVNDTGTSIGDYFGKNLPFGACFVSGDIEKRVSRSGTAGRDLYNVTAISNADVVLGNYIDESVHEYFGFILHGYVRKKIAFPGFFHTFANAMNDAGDVTGEIDDSTGDEQAFVLHDGVYSVLTPAESGVGIGTAINKSGVIVGNLAVQAFLATPD